MTKAGSWFYALGRRKSAVARVRLISGKGKIIINEQAASNYLADSQPLLSELQAPFLAVGKVDQFDLSVRVKGGGHHAQVGAITLGTARALAIMNEDLRASLRRAGLLGRDPRAKERKKFGFKSARKKRQFTKR